MYSRAEELIRKGKMPKGYGDLNPFPWACRQQRHDCHLQDGELSKYTVKYILRRRILPFLLFTQSTIKRTQTFKEDLIMSIFKGAGVAIVTPMKQILKSITINLRNYSKNRLQEKQMRSSSAERPENLQQCPKRNTAK